MSMNMNTGRLWRATTRPRHGDEGFTIVETTVAAVLAVILIVGMSQSMFVAILGARDNRLQQSGQAIALEQIEMARGMTWDELRMAFVEGTAPLLAASGIAVSGAEAGLDADEVLSVDAAAGAVTPQATETRDGVEYTIWRYVTAPDFDTRRFIVEVTWQVEDRPERFVASTLLSEASA